jgi:hypothetical protein
MKIDPTSLINRSDRLPLGTAGTMRDPDKLPLDVTIENLSETGVLLKTQDSLAVGTVISLGVAGLGMRLARISRLSADGLAAEFLLPIDLQLATRAAGRFPLTSVAIPQLPFRPNADTSEANLPREAFPSSIVRLPITPLPLPLAAQIQAASLTYGADGLRRNLGTGDSEEQVVDARFLAGIDGARPAFKPKIAGKTGLSLLLSAILMITLGMLIL